MSGVYALSEIYDLQMGKTPSRDNLKYWENGNYEWISIADLTKYGEYTGDSKEKITQKAIEESGIRVIPSHTLIMSFKLSIGKVAITSRDCFSNEAIMAFIDKGVIKIIPEYAYYLFLAQDWDKGTNRAVMGATLNKATLSKYQVYIHDEDVQKEIVYKLNKITNAIKYRRCQIEKIDDLVKSQFIEMFGDIVRNERGWRRESMDQVAPAVPYRGQLDSTDGKFWLLNLDMVEAQTGEIISKVMVDEAEIGTSTTTFGRENILYSKLRPYLNKVVVPAESGYATSEFIPLKPNPKKLNKYYFASALRSDAFVGYIQEQVAGAKMPRVSMGVFRAFLFPCPPIELQEQFAHFVEQTDKSKVLEKSGIILLHTFRRVVKNQRICYNWYVIHIEIIA